MDLRHRLPATLLAVVALALSAVIITRVSAGADPAPQETTPIEITRTAGTGPIPTPHPTSRPAIDPTPSPTGQRGPSDQGGDDDEVNDDEVNDDEVEVDGGGSEDDTYKQSVPTPRVIDDDKDDDDHSGSGGGDDGGGNDGDSDSPENN